MTMPSTVERLPPDIRAIGVDVNQDGLSFGVVTARFQRDVEAELLGDDVKGPLNWQTVEPGCGGNELRFACANQSLCGETPDCAAEPKFVRRNRGFQAQKSGSREG